MVWQPCKLIYTCYLLTLGSPRKRAVKKVCLCVSGASGLAMGSSSATTSPPRRYVAYTASFSCQHSLQQVYEFLSTHLKISREDMRLWKCKDEVLGASTSASGCSSNSSNCSSRSSLVIAATSLRVSRYAPQDQPRGHAAVEVQR